MGVYGAEQTNGLRLHPAPHGQSPDRPRWWGRALHLGRPGEPSPRRSTRWPRRLVRHTASPGEFRLAVRFEHTPRHLAKGAW